MARNMESAVRKCFPNAKIVTDRFHVVKLVLDGLQHLRVKLRWAVYINLKVYRYFNPKVYHLRHKKKSYSIFHRVPCEKWSRTSDI
jgi:transposase